MTAASARATRSEPPGLHHTCVQCASKCSDSAALLNKREKKKGSLCLTESVCCICTWSFAYWLSVHKWRSVDACTVNFTFVTSFMC